MFNNSKFFQDDINCNTNPCSNGASCTDMGNQVLCNCRPGNAGSECTLSREFTLLKINLL